MKKTVLQLLDSAINKFGDRPYVVDKTDNGWEPKTYKQVKEEALYIASGLMEEGFQRDNMAILAEGRRSWIISEYAIIMHGGTSVPLSTKLLPEEIPFRLNHSEAQAIFVSRNNVKKVLEIWKDIKTKKFKIIYFDSDKEEMQARCEKYNVKLRDSVIFYDELLETGKQAFDKQEKKLKKIADNTEEDDVVTISYTSGTTGNPKGIMLTQKNYYSNSVDSANYFQIDHHLRMLNILPIDHSFAHTVAIYTSLVVALEIYFLDSRGGTKSALKNILPNMREVKPNIMLTVPALSGNFMANIQRTIEKKGGFAKWLFDKGIAAGEAYNGNGYNTVPAGVQTRNAFLYKLADKLVFKKVRQSFGGELHYCVGGGALLDIRQQRFFYAIGIPIYQGYGLTEAAPIISANHPRIHKLGSSGKVLPTIEYKIMDAEGKELPMGTKGELVIRGNNVMKGYFKNKEATEKSIRGDWLYTEDLAYVDDDGFLIVVGREKALLISQDGEKYSPEEIEEAVTTISKMVDQVMVYNDHQKYTTALISLNKDNVEQYVKKNNITEASVLLEAIKQSFYSFRQDKDYTNKFPPQWLPKSFIILEEPFTEENHMINSTMKMVRYKITEVYKDKLEYLYTKEGATINNDENLRVVKKLFL